MTHLKTALAVLLISGSTAFAQQPPEAGDPPVVVTTGEGSVQAVPDRAWLTITAESRAGNPREAQRRNAEAMTPVIEKLKGAGIADEAIKTVGYDLQQEWDFVEGRRVSRGYVARNTIEVRVDAIDRVGELLELAVSSGATSVSGVRFDVKDRAMFEREALRLAVADARAQADALAAAADLAVERVLRIETQPIPGGPIPYQRVALLREQASAADAPPISTGEMEIRAQVTLTVALE